MPAGSDKASGLLRSRVCEIAGVNRQTRDKWAKRGLITDERRCDELDLVELVALNVLFATIRKSHVEIAWAAVRPQLRELMPRLGLTVVWDQQERTASIVLDSDSLRELACHGRPVQVIDLGTPIQRARDAFRREVSRRQSAPRAVRLRQRGQSHG